MNNEIWVNFSLSQKLKGKDTEAFDNKLNALKESASDIAPNGRLVLFLSSEKEKFSPIDKLAANLVLSRKIYNEKSFLRDPSISREFSELAEHINAINKIIDKRKKKGGRRNERNENPNTKE